MLYISRLQDTRQQKLPLTKDNPLEQSSWWSLNSWLRNSEPSSPEEGVYHRAIHSFSRYSNYLQEKKEKMGQHALLFEQAIAESRQKLSQLSDACNILEPESIEPEEESSWKWLSWMAPSTADEPEETDPSLKEEAKSSWRTLAQRVCHHVEKLEILLHGEDAFKNETMAEEVSSAIEDLTPPDEELAKRVHEDLIERIGNLKFFAENKRKIEKQQSELLRSINDISTELLNLEGTDKLIKQAIIAELKIKKQTLLTVSEEFEAAYFRATNTTEEQDAFAQWERTLRTVETFLNSASFDFVLSRAKEVKKVAPEITSTSDKDPYAVEMVRQAFKDFVEAFPHPKQKCFQASMVRADKQMQESLKAYNQFTNTVHAIRKRENVHTVMKKMVEQKVQLGSLIGKISRSKDIKRSLEDEQQRLTDSFAGWNTEGNISSYAKNSLARGVLLSRLTLEKQRLKEVCDLITPKTLHGLSGEMTRKRQFNLSTRIQLLEIRLSNKLAEAKYSSDKGAPLSDTLISSILTELENFHNDIDQLNQYRKGHAKTNFPFIELCHSEMSLVTKEQQFSPYLQAEEVKNIFSSPPDLTQKELVTILEHPELQKSLNKEERRLIKSTNTSHRQLVEIYKSLSTRLAERFTSFANFQQETTEAIDKVSRQLEVTYTELINKPEKFDNALTVLVREMIDFSTPAGKSFAKYLELMKKSLLHQKEMAAVFALHGEELKLWWQNHQIQEEFPNTSGLNPYEHASMLLVQRLPRWELLLDEAAKKSAPKTQEKLKELQKRVKNATTEANEELRKLEIKKHDAV